MRAGIQKGLAVLADHAALIDLDARPRERDRLIQPLAAQKDLDAAGGLGFPGRHDVIHPVYIIQIHRADVQYAHQTRPLPQTCFPTISISPRPPSVKRAVFMDFRAQTCYDKEEKRSEMR